MQNNIFRAVLNQLLHLLLIFFIYCGVYLMTYASYPYLSIMMHSNISGQVGFEVLIFGVDGDNHSKQITHTIKSEDKIPIENRLRIPSINLDGEIFNGDDERLLDLGVWRRPGSAIPGESGNVVLTAHRISYASIPESEKLSTTFINLDKVQEGDLVMIYWFGIRYEYHVEDIFLASPYDTTIEMDSTGDTLTMYTCDPIGSDINRLVVRAKYSM